jgi:hypothetical protein
VKALDRLAQPRLIGRMGRPADVARPAVSSTAQRSGLQAAGANMMQASNSAPALIGQLPSNQQPLPPPQPFEDVDAIMEEIRKPGCAMVQYHDSLLKARIKILHRSRVGTIASLG